MGSCGRLLRKIMAESAELTIDKALERLNVSTEKEKIILKREQETAVKELLAGRRVRQKPNILADSPLVAAPPPNLTRL